MYVPLAAHVFDVEEPHSSPQLNTLYLRTFEGFVPALHGAVPGVALSYQYGRTKSLFLFSPIGGIFIPPGTEHAAY
jgi:hypothetical protein